MKRDATAGGSRPRSARRLWLAGALVGAAALSSIPSRAAAADDDGWAALTDGAVVLFRHAEAPGVGDPPGFRLDDCATQRRATGAKAGLVDGVSCSVPQK